MVSKQGTHAEDAVSRTFRAVTLLADPTGRRGTVLHPRGVTVLAEPGSSSAPAPRPSTPVDQARVLVAGVDVVEGQLVSWAFGSVAADAGTPVIAFQRLPRLVLPFTDRLWAKVAPQRSVAARRLSSTVWAAQVPGDWPDPRVA